MDIVTDGNLDALLDWSSGIGLPLSAGKVFIGKSTLAMKLIRFYGKWHFFYKMLLFTFRTSSVLCALKNQINPKYKINSTMRTAITTHL